MKHYSEFGLTPLIAVVDIETLDTAPTAIILSIGCVVVNVFTGQEVANFYEVIDQDFQIVQGRTSSESTLKWWQKQENKTAWESIIHDGEMIELDDALNDFNEFLVNAFDGERIQIMGNGPEFDNVKIAHAMQQLDITPAWDHGGNQSLRTAVWMGRMLLGIDPKYTLELEQGEVKHHALHDARHEARYLYAIFQAFILSMPHHNAKTGVA